MYDHTLCRGQGRVKGGPVGDVAVGRAPGPQSDR